MKRLILIAALVALASCGSAHAALAKSNPGVTLGTNAPASMGLGLWLFFALVTL
jgi:methionine-rich copper-binding protein CopC